MKPNFLSRPDVRWLAATAMLATLPVLAVDPIPDWKTLIFPTLVPKAGMGNVVPSDMSSGTIRQRYESIYEEYWKETSYFDYDQVTGAKIRGHFNDTKTYGYTQVPWAIRPPTGTSGGGLGGERFRDGWRRTYLVYNGRDAAPAGATTTTDRFGNQWYYPDACDNDDVWTPGESFFDRDGDHKWDPAVPAEDYWNSDHYNGNTFLQRRSAGGAALGNLTVILPGGTYRAGNNTAAYLTLGGELFVDFNDSNQGGAVQPGSGPGYDNAVDIIYWLGGTQQGRIVNHNELDFTPFDGTSVNEGDAAHTVVVAADPVNNSGVVPGSVARNGQFDYTSDSAGTPQVTAIGRYVEYQAYVYTNTSRDSLGFYRYDDVWRPANGIYPATPDLSTNNTRDNVGIRKVRAFIYQTRELYSNLKAPNEYGDEPGNPIPPRTVVVDNQWTDRSPGEKFEDFVSFRDAAGNSIYVDLTTKPGFVPTSTNIGQVQNNGTQGRDRGATITWTEYEQYVTWNYPGVATSLLARAGNGRYDGPEEWEESFSKKITPSDTTLATLEPDIFSGHWLDQWLGYFSWSDWYLDLFGEGVSAPPAFPGAVQQVNTYTPVNYAEGVTNQWIPNNSWGYDAPAEFCDLPSSMYHLGGDELNAITLLGGNPNSWTATVQGVWKNPSANAVSLYGGDKAFGEETSPWSTSSNGQDLWDVNPASPSGPDGIITSTGPFGYNTIGVNGFDGADVLTLEVITRKIDGVTGVDDHPIQLRDTNLDGIWDGGNTRVGQAYYNAKGDGSGDYPFNRQRFMEDVIANWDQAENFVDLGVTTTIPGTTLYGFPIYPNSTNAGWAALGGPAGAFDAILTRDSTLPIGITFQVRPMNGTLDEVGGSAGTNDVRFSGDFGMAILCHEQGHDIQGWPDLYDYDVWSTTGGEIVNTPVAAYDLMSGGGLVHGIANMKATAGTGPWVTMRPLEPLIPVGMGPVTLDLYPAERIEDQYYQLTNPNNPFEFIDLWFVDNNSSYGVAGGRGVYITHQDFSFFGPATPIQQRINGHFTWEVIQADGLNQLQDAVNFGDGGDPFPGTSNNRTFTADGNPAARWWNQADMGMRILDVQLPTAQGQPARVTFERYDTSSPWPWSFNFADTDNDGIADAWEYHFFGDLTTAGAKTDYDLDGLNDLNEYLGQLDPMHRYSADPNGLVDDSDYDSDGDLLSNSDEQNLYASSPSLPDTDDDGILDGQEITAGFSPTNSLSPLIDRVIDLGSAASTNYLRIPNGINPEAGSMRLALETFGLDAWVYPRSSTTPAELFVRAVNTVSNFYNFRLVLTTNRQLELSFTHVDGRTNAVLTTAPMTALPLSAWSHVSASFDLPTQTMRIYINGQQVAQATTPLRPMTGGALTSSTVDCLVGRNFNGLVDEVRVWNRDPGTRSMAQLKAPLTGSEAGLQVYYRFDDGTHTNGVSGIPAWQLGEAQNFVSAYSRDWLTGWANAASLAGQAAFAAAPTNAPVLAGSVDSDGDTLPDWWETQNGFNPADSSNQYGMWGDPDGDGLNNRGEYLAGTDPNNFDTSGNGFGDYYSTSSVSPNIGMMFGELYDDGDMINDSWEIQYPTLLSPLTYDASLDPDADGWDNYSEFKANTDPGNPSDFPQPTVQAIFNYTGTNVTGNILVHSFNRAEMDGTPNSITEIAAAGTYPRTINITTPTTGHFRQGKNWFYAWIDLDGDNNFDVGEPAAIANLQPIPVYFAGPVPVEFNFTEAGLRGMQRLSWEGAGLGNSVTVRITRTTSAGAPVILIRSNLQQRSYFHEGDYIFAGAKANYGLEAGTETFKPGYAAYVSGAGTSVITRTFTFDWSQALATPVAVSPNGASLPFARNELVWTQSYAVSRNILEIRAGTTNGAPIYVGDLLAPARDLDGFSRAEFPFLLGDGSMTNGTYYWRMISANPRQTSAPSAWAQYTVNLQQSAAGAYAINGTLYYFGKVTNGNFRIEAFSNEGFGEFAHARLSLGTAKGAFSLKGLRAGTYYVRAYVDQNNNKQCDAWESWGIIKQSALFDGFYAAKALTLPGNSVNEDLIIMPHDSDGDDIPDDWEYANFGNLTKANGVTDTDKDGLLDRIEYASTALDSNPNVPDTDGDGILDGAEVLTFGTDPTKADSDGDGLNDGSEVAYGSNPLVRDSDGDGVPDALEYAKGASSVQPDSDNDGYPDALEIVLGTSPANAASRPASPRLVNVVGLVPGPTHDLIHYAPVATASNILYDIQVAVEAKADLRTSWTTLAPSLRSIGVSQWSMGPWSYTNAHGTNTTIFYDVNWSIP